MLFLHNMRLFVRIVNEYSEFNVDCLDLIQEGNIGLMKAIENFDSYKGYCFSTFATPYIRGYINRYMCKNLRTVKLSVEVACEGVKYKNLVDKYFKEYGCYPNSCYIMEKMNISKERYDYIAKNSLSVLSLDCAIEFDNDECNDMSLLDLIPSSFEKFNDVVNSIVFEELFSSLKEKDKNIIKMLFGIEPYKRMYTLEEVGLLYGLSKQRISQIKYNVLKKLKDTDAFKSLMDEDLYLNDNVISR